MVMQQKIPTQSCGLTIRVLLLYIKLFLETFSQNLICISGDTYTSLWAYQKIITTAFPI